MCKCAHAFIMTSNLSPLPRFLVQIIHPESDDAAIVDQVTGDIIDFVLRRSPSCANIFEDPKEIEKYLQKAGLFFIVLDQDPVKAEPLVGFLLAEPIYEYGTISIHILCASGRGSGTLLMDALLNYARTNNYNTVYIHDAIDSAVPFYQRFGFIPTDEEDQLVLSLNREEAMEEV